MLPFDEYLDGIIIPKTFSAPKALSARQATKAESIPPEMPIKAFWKPVLAK